jgi:hypothetical protein
LAKFAGEITARLQNANPNSPEAALLLADNLTAASDEIKKEFGQAKANEFMSRVLLATDAGVTEKELTFAISGFFSQIIAESQNDADFSEKLENMQNFLNKGLDLTLDARQLRQMIEDGDKPGLSYALNNFFNTKADISEDGQTAEVKGFNSGFERVYMRVQPGNAAESGVSSWRHNFGAIKDISLETINLVSSFLRDRIGDEALAAYLEKESDFLSAVTTSIAVVAKEYGQRAAAEYVDFLNSNVAPAISSATGAWYLKGWELEGDYPPAGARPGTDLWVSGGGQAAQNNPDPAPGGVDNDSGQRPILTVDVDMSELYAAYKKVVALPIPTPDNLNNPVGNLLDIQA